MAAQAPLCDACSMNDVWTNLIDDRLMLRICSEFAEMPCLRLTVRQAQRLFGLSERLCVKLLDTLVERRFLVQNADGTYARRTEGPADLRSVTEPKQRQYRERIA